LSQNKRIKCGVCIPCMETVPIDFAVALCQMVSECRMRGVSISVFTSRSSLVEISRDKLVLNAIKYDMDYVFFVDSDMTFPSDVLMKLLERNVDIVCCDASRKKDEGGSVVKTKDLKYLDYKTIKGLVEVEWAGTGVMLLKIDVFKKMQKPWFLVEYDKPSDMYLGEDYYMCSKAKALGYKIFCDTTLSLEIGHIGHKEYKIKGL
jgi:hypothetical protein